MANLNVKLGVSKLAFETTLPHISQSLGLERELRQHYKDNDLFWLFYLDHKISPLFHVLKICQVVKNLFRIFKVLKNNDSAEDIYY